MSENIAIAGAGICGLCASLALAANGNRVTIYERDAPPPAGAADRAFFDWHRRGAAQFRHPHAFLAVMCNLLQKHYPDLVQAFRAAGAQRLTFRDMLNPDLLAQYKPLPSDDDIWLLLCRRATMETVLRRYVEKTRGITINSATSVTGIESDPAGGTIRVTGLKLRTRGGPVTGVHHDLIVDASGRLSRFPDWLAALGAHITTEDHDADIVYYTRHYRLRPGEQAPPPHSRARPTGDLDYLRYGVFPADNDHFAVILCLPNHETELREAVKSPALFDAICDTIPGLAPWVNREKSAPTTPPFGFGNIHAVWRRFARGGQPAALNYFAVGDAAVTTNPLYGRGCSTGVIHAHLLADLLAQTKEPVARALAFDRQTEAALRPIFNASLREDKRGIRRAAAALAGGQAASFGEKSVRKRLRAALGDAIMSASREQIHVMRGVMRSFNLMEKPGKFLRDGRICWTLLRYLLRGQEKNNRARVQRGPRRGEMLALVRGRRHSEAAQAPRRPDLLNPV